MVRATKPITDCIGDILELLAESETVLIDTYRDDIFDQIKYDWFATCFVVHLDFLKVLALFLRLCFLVLL